MDSEKDTIRTSLRLPRELYEKLARAAGNKTMHAEILERLELSFDPLVTNLRANGDFYGELDKIVERVIRRVHLTEEGQSIDDAMNAGPHGDEG